MLKYRSELESLNLPIEEYAVFGSGPMAVRGFHVNHDIDIVVSKGLYEDLVRRYPRGETEKYLQLTEHVEAWYDWVGWTEDEIPKLLEKSEIIEGIPFVPLEFVLAYKKEMLKRPKIRPKDKEHIKLIEYYMVSRETMVSKKRLIGDVGEELAGRFLMKRDFKIVERNYLKKWGEIDIITKKGHFLHFVEVKTISSEIALTPKSVGAQGDSHRPEENVHPRKLQRLRRAIETYILDRNIKLADPGSDKPKWGEVYIQVDVIVVRLDMAGGQAKIEVIENVIPEGGWT